MRLGDVAANPRNPKTHPARQAAALQGVVREVGWAGVPLAYYSARNGGAMTFVDGHLRGQEFPDATVRVAVTDLDDAAADLLLLTFDPLAQMAAVAGEQVTKLLADMATADQGRVDLALDIDARLAEFAPLAAAWTNEERLPEVTKTIRPIKMLRVLVSVPVDAAVQVRAALDALLAVPGIEIDYGGN